MAFKSELYKIDPETGDILESAKKTLGDYLSRRTSKATDGVEKTGGPDDFTYNPPRANPFSIAAESSVGQVTPAEAGINNQSVFARDQDDLERWSKSGDFDTDKFILNDLDQQDRHRLLKQAATSGESNNDLTAEMQRQIGVNLSRNRFAPTNKFTDIGEEGRTRGASKQAGAAVTLSRTDRVPVSSTTESQSLYEEMANQALSALIAATGETPKEIANKTTPNDVLKPSSVQGNFETLRGTGLEKLDTRNLHSSDVANYSRLAFDPNDAEKLDNAFVGAEGAPEEGSYTRFSHGNLNSYLEPFGTALPTSMIATAGVLLVCSVVLTLVTAALLNAIAKSLPVVINIKPLGSDRGDPFGTGLNFTGDNALQNFFCKVLGLIHPYPEKGITASLPYLEAALLGVSDFVGINFSKVIDPTKPNRESPQSTLDLGNIVTNALGGSGYYVVMTRNIMRSLTLLGESADFSSAGSSKGVESVEDLMTFLDKVRTSKVIRFTDTMARLGVVRQMVDLRSDFNAMTKPGDEEIPTLRVSQSRSLKGLKALSHRHVSAANRGAYFLPKSFRYASIAYNNGVKNIAGLLGKTGKKSDRTKKSLTRDVYLTSEEVRDIEDQLEAEYVPFYLQDLRTNEILNFHAFLESLEDSYSPSYTSVDGYGRMDPVQIYKGTTRSVSLSFIIAATNPDDFDRMWFTINKLTMMVYPQWTGGEELTGVNADGKTYTFTQPFSQTIGASPLVRMRVGELIHSNYSRFGLARIFGLGGISTETGKRHFTTEGEEDISAEIEFLSLSRDTGSDLGPIGQIETTGETAQTLTSKFVGIRVDVKPENHYNAGTTLSEVKSSGGAPYSISTTSTLKADIVEFVEMPSADGTFSIFAVVSLQEPITTSSVTGDGTESDVSVSFLSAPVDLVTPDNSYYESLYNSTQPEQRSSENQKASVAKLGTLAALSENFGSAKAIIASDQSNSLIRSFEAAGGRGLAGAITSLGYTWFEDNITWETEQGKRAPMWCKVSIGFAPIHDIPMGLDSEGFPRAVPYPVGNLSRSTFFPELHNNDTEKITPMLREYDRKVRKT